MAEGFQYKPQTKVDWGSGQAYQQFRMWRKEVERILNGPMHGDSDTVKLNTVYIWAGAHAETLIEAKQSEDPTVEVKTPKQLLDTLADCLSHTTLFREAREDFYNAHQKVGENTTTYYSRVMELYRLAEFPANSDFLIVDKLIHGCTNSDCKRKLMAKDKTVTVKACLDLLRQYEAVSVTMKHLANDPQKVSATYSRDPTKKSQRNGEKRRTKSNPKPPDSRRQHNVSSRRHNEGGEDKRCRWCGGDIHRRDECPAKETKCNFCHKKGHFERACQLKRKASSATGSGPKRQNAITVESDYSDEESTYDVGIVSINNVRGNTREVLAKVEFLLPTPATLKGKVDTGAMATCMPMSLLQDIGLAPTDLEPTDATLRGVTGVDMKACGKLEVEVRCNSQKQRTRIIVTELGDELILGLDFCRLFDLVTVANTCIQRQVVFEQKTVHITDESDVDYDHLRQKWKKHLPLGKHTGDPLGDIKAIFPDTFDGTVGLFDGEAELKVSPDAKPVQLPPRAIALSVLPKLKAELDKMESEGIIRPCPEPTDWVHNIVVVSKKNGDIRICLDPKNLNKYLIRSVHHTASWEDASTSFAKGEFFSTLDAKSGYWSKKLSSDSQLLTAFNTPFKKYCFTRLPFGLSVSSEIFCEQMDKALAGIPGTFPCADDVKIQGSTEERHDIHLLETVARAQAAGLKFNPEKCAIKRRKISYFGRVISPKGVEPCPDKVKAICNLQPPTDKQELQSFLGSVNFMASFIPHLAQRTFIMRGLLKKDVHFVWTSDMQREFDVIKQAIADATGLRHFDTDKPVTIETDASLKGLGAVLLQDGQPVKFLSKSLTKAETDYSNIERELLAVLFACEKLHIYVYGRTVTIHTDHKPLEAIFHKPISLAPARLQRMLLRLRMYDLDVKYVGAKSVLLADTLSRLVQPGAHPAIPGLNVTIAEVLKIRPTHLESLRAETHSDPTLSKLRQHVINGWPESMQDLSEDLHPYWCFRDELVILDGLLMKGNRVVVPSALRTETLTRLHDGHQGLTATLQRARRSVYWPNLQADISATLQSCDACQIHANKKPRIPDRQVSASRPMEILGVDLMHFKGKIFLVSVDYFSGYISVDFLTTETSDAVIRALNNQFRKFGLAERIISDNGPCFKAEKFRQFCEALGICHTTSSPHYHEGNGRAERAIQTVKQMQKKSTSDVQLTMAIIAYHDTPASSDLPSPAELFFNRKINSRLGLMFQPATLTDIQKSELAKRRAAHLKPFAERMNYAPEDPVWFTEDGSPEWKPGYIESRDARPDSFWLVSEDGSRRLRRNRHDIKPRVPFYKQRQPNKVPHPVSSHPASPPPAPVEVPHPPAAPDEPMFVPLEPLDPPDPKPVRVPPTPAIPSVPSPRKKPDPPSQRTRTPARSPNVTRSGREIKPTRKPDFVYKVRGEQALKA